MPVAFLPVTSSAAAAVSGANVLGAVDGVVVEDGDAGRGPEGARLGAGGLAARPVAVVQAVTLERARSLVPCKQDMK